VHEVFLLGGDETGLGKELPRHVQPGPRPLRREHAGGAEDPGKLQHHAANRFRDRSFRETEAVWDMSDGTVVQRRGVEDHAFLESAGELVADGVVDRAVGAHVARAPAAGAAGNVCPESDAVTGLHARNGAARFYDPAGDLVADDGWCFYPIIAEMKNADVGTA